MSYSMAILRYDEIISELKDGNYAKGSTAFVRKHQNFVYNTALRYLNSVEDAEDISQEVFVKALESIDNFRGESSIKTWLYRITKNFCLNQLRKKKIKTIFSLSSWIDIATRLSIFFPNDIELLAIAIHGEKLAANDSVSGT